VRLVYFDECKYDPPTQPHYWLGAISVASDDLVEVEEAVNALSREYFGTQQLSAETEFHAKDIFHRKGHFKTWKDVTKRLECLQRLAAIVGSPERIRRLHVRIDPAKMLRNHGWEADAFMFLVEKVQLDARSLGETCILVGDLDGEFSKASVANLSRFREQGTDFVFGKTIDRILDSAYFIPSHHSRLLQLADVYTYCLQMCEGPDDGSYPRRAMREFIRKETELLRPHRYKDWPTNWSWHAKRNAA
jgi:hypothetical protein